MHTVIRTLATIVYGPVFNTSRITGGSAGADPGFLKRGGGGGEGGGEGGGGEGGGRGGRGRGGEGEGRGSVAAAD